MKKCFSLYLSFVLIVFISCQVQYLPTKAEYRGYAIASSMPNDSAMQLLLKPYRNLLEKSMNEVVGKTDATLEKHLPEGTLNNFMADAMLFGARKKFGTAVDAAVVNYGGIRITQLPRGEVTRGKIYELMPFDNLLILQNIRGDSLLLFLHFIAERGGWPLAGIKMQIRAKKAVNVFVGNQPLDINKVYVIANSDYVANGGDNASLLKNFSQLNKGYLMRDALFDYIAALKEEGKHISAHLEKRISYAQ